MLDIEALGGAGEPGARVDYYGPRRGKVYVAGSLVLIAAIAALGLTIILVPADAPWNFKLGPVAILLFVLGKMFTSLRAATSRLPVLSLLEQGLEVRKGRSFKSIPYRALYSAEVEHIPRRAGEILSLRSIENGTVVLTTVTSNWIEASLYSVVEAIAARIPAENSPRSGWGMLICRPPGMTWVPGAQPDRQ
jgi:hypothetical protein